MMPVSTLLVVVIVCLVLVGMIFHAAYDLGREKEKTEHEMQKSNASAQARRLRTRLDDPAVVERLHNVFKR